MKLDELQKHIASSMDALPGRLQEAARVVLDRPDDIALHSMRDICQRAGLHPTVMTRLVRSLGFESYEDFRRIFANSLRGRGDTFFERAEELLRQNRSGGDDNVLVNTLAQAELNIAELRLPETLSAIQRAADILASSRRIFWLGARSSYPAMFLGSYLMSFLDKDSLLVESAGGIGMDRLRHIGVSDAVVALSIDPYTATTVDAVRFAADRQARVLAITDSFASPLAKVAAETIVVPIETPSFIHSMAPAFVVVESLVALVAAKLGEGAREAIAAAEGHVRAFNSYVSRTSFNKAAE